MDIKINNICKSYNKKNIFSNFSIVFDGNKNYCLTGESGAGKTTLLHIIAGLIKPDSGEITGVKNKRISVIFQEDRLCEPLSVRTNIKMTAAERYDENKVIRDLSSLGLSNVTGMYINELSGGMKRRIAILRAFSVQSDLILMDEPFKGLDSGNKSRAVDFISERAAGKSIIWVTHDTGDAVLFDSKIINISNMKI